MVLPIPPPQQGPAIMNALLIAELEELVSKCKVSSTAEELFTFCYDAASRASRAHGLPRVMECHIRFFQGLNVEAAVADCGLDAWS